MAADNLLSPVTGLLTGGLVWAALPGDFGPFAKLLTAFTSALASAIAVKFTRTVQRESKLSTKITFVPEHNRLALRRLLPVLVDRFCELGIPPIFVVDELDKVPDISERMQNLMGFLKQFVTERAFFCFLADRDYYEALEAKVSLSAFPLESTLFGDRLFVQYAPEATHNFLTNVIKMGSLTTGESKDDAERDLQVLRYVLLRRSFMHPFDLRREISRCTNAKNEFRFPPRALFNVQQYRNEVYYQVAVECVLAGEKLLDFAEDPNRAQLVYDALYFPIRTKKLPEEFDSSRDKLKEHLAARMGKDNGKLLSDEDCDTLYDAVLQLINFLCEPRLLVEAMQSLSTATYLQTPRSFPPAVVGVIEAAAGPKVSVAETATDASAQMQAVAAVDSVASAQTVAPTITAPPVSSAPAVVTVAANSASAPQSTTRPLDGSATKATPLLVPSTISGRYRWQFDKFGYPFVPGISIMRQVQLVKKGAAESDATLTAAQATSTLISDFEEAARLLISNQGTALDIELWERMRLIPTPPAWSFVREAAEALRNPALLSPTRIEEYNKALTDYRSYLESSLAPIWHAVAVAATMTLHASKSEFVKQERKSLEALAEVLAECTSRDKVLDQLQAIAGEAISGYPPPSVTPGAGYREMIQAIAASANSLRRAGARFTAVASVQAAASYQEWFTNFYMGNRPELRSFWPFLGLVTDSLPFGLRKLNPLRMTIADWTQARSEQQNANHRIVILERLGFRIEVDHLLTNLRPQDRSALSDAIAKSIQMRGYEKDSIVLRCLRPSVADQWLPSENFACRLSRTESDPKADADYISKAKYVVLEIDRSMDLEQIRKQISSVGNAVRIALFGPADWTPPSPNLLRGLPCILGPQSLDDLVSRLDARPPTDWETSKAVAA